MPKIAIKLILLEKLCCFKTQILRPLAKRIQGMERMSTRLISKLNREKDNQTPLIRSISALMLNSKRS